MSVIQSTAMDSYGGSGGGVGGKSIRLRNTEIYGGGPRQFLSRTQVTPTATDTATYSIWVKNTKLYTSTGAALFATGYGGGAQLAYYTGGNALRVASGGSGLASSLGLFRDTCAWYHHVFTFTAGSWAVYTNNVLAFSGTNTIAGLNRAAQTQRIGNMLAGDEYLDACIAEVNFVDGQILSPSAFGEYDAITGQWVPKKYTGTYGANGFYLDFSDGTSLTTLGYDKSGNNNHWILNNMSLTSGANYDWCSDYPTNNFCTLNLLKQYTAQTVSKTELNYYTTTGSTILGTQGMSSGKWYWEVLVINNSGTQAEIGIATDVFSPSGNDFTMTASGYAYMGSANKRNNSSLVAYGATYTNGDVIGVALDLDAGTLTFYKNNVSQGVAYSGIPANTYFAALGNGNSANSKEYAINFGQRPFTYSTPAGFKTLCTQNLSDPVVKNSADQFKSIYVSGATIKATAQGIFTNEIAWMKDTGTTASGQIADSARGVNSILVPNSTAVPGAFVTPTSASMGFVWNLGGDGVTTLTGSITGNLWANPDSGVSVVTYTGTGVAGTIGHGLGKAPGFILVKKTSAVGDWVVYHQSQGATKHSILNSSAAVVTSARWNNTAPTWSVFSVGTDTTVNAAGATYVAYCFTEIDGFSKFGSYIGNSNADGPFINLGFDPEFWMLKSVDGTANWSMYSRPAMDGEVNPMTGIYYVNSASLANGNPIDMVSNGVKIRANATGYNTSGTQYYYVAFAASPFKYALAR